MILEDRRSQVLRGTFLGVRGSGRMTLHSLLYDKYLPWASTAKAASSYRRDTYSAKRLCEHLGDQRVRSLSVEQIEIYRQRRIDEGVMQATCNRELALLRHCVNKAIQWGLLSGDNPAGKVKSFRERHRVRFLSQDERVRLLHACSQSSQPLLLPLVKLALLSGLRSGELHALRWDDLDLQGGTLTVRHGKGDKSRIVPVNAEAIIILKSINRTSDLVFSIGSFKHSFMTAVRLAELENFRFHDLRRCYATALLTEGADLITVRDLLGHAEIPQTLIYLASSQDRLRRAVDNLPKLDQQSDVVDDTLEGVRVGEGHTLGTHRALALP